MGNTYDPLRGTPAGWPFASSSILQYKNSDVQNITNTSNTPGPFNSQYGAYNSFTGSDIVAYIHIPSQEPPANSSNQTPLTKPVVGILGNIQTISYSTFREVNPVRSLGNAYVDSYTRGPRTIAGTIVWTVLDQYVLAQALQFSDPDSANSYKSMLIDQIPPFVITITMSNEYGAIASMALKGVRIVNEGSTYSIDDMITESTNTFVASDIDLLHKGEPFDMGYIQSAQNTSTSILINAKMNNANSVIRQPLSGGF